MSEKDVKLTTVRVRYFWSLARVIVLSTNFLSTHVHPVRSRRYKFILASNDRTAPIYGYGVCYRSCIRNLYYAYRIFDCWKITVLY